MNLTFAAQLNKMITAGLGGAVEAPETGVAVGRRVEYTSIGPAPILTFEANSELPLKALSITMEPIQDLHGQANPYPAGGGKNLLQNDLTSRTSNGITVTVNEFGEISFSGTATETTIFVIKTDIKDILTVDENYILSGCSGGGNGTYRLEIYKQIGNNAVNYNGDTAFTILSTDTNCVARIVIANGMNMSGVKIFPMIRLASVSDSTFAPYSNICPISGRSEVNVWREATYDTSAEPALTIQLGQTVYGGTVDVVSGEMVVDRAMVDMGTLAWVFRDSGTAVAPYFYSPIEILGVKYEGNFQTVAYNILCSMYKTVSRDTSTFVDGTVCVDGAQTTQSVTQFQIKDSRYSDAASFKTAMNGVQLCYELAQPITITLTPEQLTALIGTNNVWSDADEVSLTYGNIYYTEGY